jgi:hypothetical protein
VLAKIVVKILPQASPFFLNRGKQRGFQLAPMFCFYMKQRQCAS